MGAAKHALREQGLQHMAAKLGQLSQIRNKVAHPRQLAQVLIAIMKAGNSTEDVQGMGKKDARTKSVGPGVETSEEEPEQEHEQAKHEEASQTFDSEGSQVVQEHEQATNKAMVLLARRLQVVEARLDLLLSGEEGQELSAPKSAETSATHILNTENMGSDEVDLNEITSSGEPDFLKGDGVEADEMVGEVMQIGGALPNVPYFSEISERTAGDPETNPECKTLDKDATATNDAHLECVIGDTEGALGVGDVVVSAFDGICEVIRVGYGQFQGEVRLLRGHEARNCWENGCWRDCSFVKRLTVGMQLETVEPVPLLDGSQVKAGILGTVTRVERDSIQVTYWDLNLNVNCESFGCFRVAHAQETVANPT